MSVNPDNLFQVYVPPALIQQGEDLTKIHYGINLGAFELRVNMYQFGRMRRGIIYPIQPYDRKENNSDSTDEINDIILQYYQPGLIAQAIERDFQDKGFRVLRNITGQELGSIKEMYQVFQFEDIETWPNAEIQKFLKDYQAKKDSQFTEMAKYLAAQLNIINGYQIQHMAEAKKSINDGLKPGLNEYDKLVCKAIGRNPSDYEVNEVERRKAAAESQEHMIEGFAKAVVAATAAKPEAFATDEKTVKALKEDNDYLRKELKAYREEVQEQREVVKKIDKFMRENSARP